MDTERYRNQDKWKAKMRANGFVFKGFYVNQENLENLRALAGRDNVPASAALNQVLERFFQSPTDFAPDIETSNWPRWTNRKPQHKAEKEKI